jgi:hypothetical protein
MRYGLLVVTVQAHVGGKRAEALLERLKEPERKAS